MFLVSPVVLLRQRAINKGVCIRYLQNGVQEYLLDGGSNNKTIVEQTLEIMARMKMAPNQDYTFDKGGRIIGIRFCDVYDRYTKYRRDYAVTGGCLPYNQFLKQLRQSDFFLESNKTMRFGNETKKAWALDFSILKERRDLSGLEIIDMSLFNLEKGNKVTKKVTPETLMNSHLLLMLPLLPQLYIYVREKHCFFENKKYTKIKIFVYTPTQKRGNKVTKSGNALVKLV